MDRSIVYAGAGVQDTELLAAQRGAMVALGMLSQLVLGPAAQANAYSTGLLVQPTTPNSLQPVVGPGALFNWDTVDATAYGTLPADLHGMVQCAYNLDPVTLPALSPPGGGGQAVVYLIQAQAAQQDAAPQVLPFWNAANPGQPFLGPNNTGQGLPTARVRRVAFAAKAGAAAPLGSQIAPNPDPGWSPLATVILVSGQTSFGSADLVPHALAPTVTYGLPQLSPGYTRRQRLFGSGSWTVPRGVTLLRITRTGGGGGGGNCQANGQNGGANVAGGGGAGATEIDDVGVQPGNVFSYTQGLGGAAQSDGAASLFASLAPAAPGRACTGFSGSAGAVYSAGGVGGTASAAGFSGGDGSDGQNDPFRSYGNGGASYWGGGGRAATGAGRAGRAPGSGGGGAYDATGSGIVYKGGAGADGLVMVEY